MALIQCYECDAKISELAASCPLCGAPAKAPRESPESQNTKSEIKDANINSNDRKEPEDIVQFANQFSLDIGGTLAGSVRKTFCQILKAKTFNDVLCDMYISQDVILVVPAAKDKSGLVLAGLVLTGGVGALGALGMAAGAAIGQVFRNKQAESVKAIIQNLTNTLIIDASSVSLKAYDYRQHWDLSGGEWETRISIEGKAIFNGIEGTATVVFGYPGKTYERTFLTKANNKAPELAKHLNIPAPNISKETKFIW